MSKPEESLECCCQGQEQQGEGFVLITYHTDGCPLHEGQTPRTEHHQKGKEEEHLFE